jgi:hypothetical protein
VPSLDGPAVDRPGGDAIAVVHLLERDPGVDHRLLHRRGVRHGVRGQRVERLDEHAHAAIGDPGGDERTGVLQREQPGLDPHAAPHEELAQLDDPRLALVGGDEVRQLRPGGDEGTPPVRVGLDRGGRAQRDRDAGAGGADRAQSGRAWYGGERLPAVVVMGMEVERASAGGDGGLGLRGQLGRRARRRRMVAVAVQRGLQQRRAASRAGARLAPAHRRSRSTTSR